MNLKYITTTNLETIIKKCGGNSHNLFNLKKKIYKNE